MKLKKVLVFSMLAFTTVFATVGFVSSASANSLVSTSPVAGSTVTAAPSAITLNTQDVVMDAGNTVTVTDPQGGRVDDGTLTVNATTVVAGLKLMTVSGVYTVAYTLLTNNDVPLQGTYTFTFKAPSVITTPTISTPTPTSSEAPASTGLGVPVLIVGLIFAVVAVFLFLVYYAWKLLKKK